MQLYLPNAKNLERLRSLPAILHLHAEPRIYDDKWDLVIKFAELILELKPDVFSMENSFRR